MPDGKNGLGNHNGEGRRPVLIRQIEIHGQRFEFCSTDGGRTWSTDPRSLIAYRRRQERARTEVRKRFEEMEEEIRSLDPDDIYHANLPQNLL